MATSLHQWSRQYIRVTQLERCSPEKRARMRAFFADGEDKMHIPWAVEGLPALLHLSVFLFFGGLAIFLFNIDRAVFSSVIWWIGLFLIAYGLITVMPIVRHSSPYYSPLSRTAWFLYASMNYIIFKVFTFIASRYASDETWIRFYASMIRYRGWMLGGVEKAAEKTVEERSSEIDIRIFGWTMGVLGEDESLEMFFEAIPGLFASKLVKHLERDIPWRLSNTSWDALDGFMGRTSSSNSVTESVKYRRLTICRDIMSLMPCPPYVYVNLCFHFDEAPTPTPVTMSQAMARWIANDDDYVAYFARVGVARNLVRMQNRDDDWIALASDLYGISERDIRVNVSLGRDNALLAILIDVSRRAIHSRVVDLVRAIAQFDIHHTLPRLQHDFCTLWNELVHKARGQGGYNTPDRIICSIYHHYIALHQATDASPTVFSAPANYFDDILCDPLSYPLCDNASHRPDSTTVPNSPAVSLFTQPGGLPYASPDPLSRDSSAVPQQAELANIIAGPRSPSGPTTPSEIGDSSQAPAATPLALPVHTTSHATNPSPPGTVIALHDAPPAATLSHPLEGTTQRDIAVSCAEPGISGISSTASTSCDAGTIPTCGPSLLASSVSIPAPPTTSHHPPFPNPAELLDSVPPAPDIAATSSDDLMPPTNTRELRETSQAPMVPLISTHPDPISPTTKPSTRPDSSDPDALRSSRSSAYLFHSLDGNKQQDIVAPYATPDVSEIPSMANSISRSTLTIAPTFVVSDSLSSPILIPALPDSVTTAEPPSSIESTSFQPDHISHASRFPSSSLTATSSRISPQVGAASDAQATSSVGTPSSHDDTHGLNRPIPMTALSHSDQRASPVRHTVATTLKLDDQLH